MMLLVDGGAPLKSVTTVLRSFREKPPRDPPRTWQLWADKVARILVKQPRLASPGGASVAGPGTIEIRDNPVPEARVVEAIAEWDRTGRWPERWSSPPGEQFCEIPRRLWPARLLAEAAS